MSREIFVDPSLFSSAKSITLQQSDVENILDSQFAYPTLAELKHNELKQYDPEAVFEYQCDPYSGKCSINAEDFKKSVHLKALGVTRSVEMVMQTVAENQTLFCAQQVGGYVLREADRTVVYVKNKSFAPNDGTRLGVVDMAATRKALKRAYDTQQPESFAFMFGKVFAGGVGIAAVILGLMKKVK